MSNKTSLSGDQNNTTENNTTQNNANDIKFHWWGISSILCCVTVAIVIFASIRLLFDSHRYSLASEALKSGNTSVAMAAMAPEIGTGANMVTRGVTSGLGSIFSLFSPKTKV